MIANARQPWFPRATMESASSSAISKLEPYHATWLQRGSARAGLSYAHISIAATGLPRAPTPTLPASGRGGALRIWLAMAINNQAARAFDMVRTPRVGCTGLPLPLAEEGWGGGTLRCMNLTAARGERLGAQRFMRLGAAAFEPILGLVEPSRGARRWRLRLRGAQPRVPPESIHGF
jgi:hypothetical protein